MYTEQRQQILNVSDIKKHYGSQQVLDGVSFSCTEGQCVGIVGVNGSGKSTLLSILAGVNSADSGKALLQGEDILKNNRLIGQYIGYVPQENPLIEDLSVRDNLRLWYGKRSNELMKSLAIEKYNNKLVKKLSGGMKKKVAISIALYNSPKVLMLDEPGASLDLEGKKIVRDYLKEYLAKGGTIIIVSHDDEELNLCHSIYALVNGRAREVDPRLRGEKLLKEMMGEGK